ncbi:MAG: hypothetical protein K9M56_05645 [Victivallales bacterium]|nr:hypothetical protein [Victivallales bacterium]
MFKMDVLEYNKKIDLENKSLSFHIVGVFGIGMSGLAQYLKWKGFEVSGSDRALFLPENKSLYDHLLKLGIKLYAQDGSYIKYSSPDYIVYSTAIEDGNPDYLVSEGIRRLHRAELLIELFEHGKKGRTSIAVAGTSGKTTVASLIAETFERLKLDPVIIVGGFIKSFITDMYPGNFKPGNGKWLIFESDESDKSLLRFFPDYTVLLNIGKDHYSIEELIKVFEKFLLNTQKGAVIEKEIFKQLNPEVYSHLDVVLFSDRGETNLDRNNWYFENYKIKKGNITVDFKKNDICRHFNMPIPGKYNAGNFLAVQALYDLLNMGKIVDISDFLNSMTVFQGVQRRFEYIGKALKDVDVYCDFAHNANKIEGALKCAKGLCSGKVFAVFQPHGFKPFRFMLNELFSAVEKNLGKEDRFILMPVYYSGGSCIPDPKSSDVAEEFAEKSEEPEKFISFSTRNELKRFLKDKTQCGDIVIIMGARDNSLPGLAKEILKEI